MSHKCSKCDNVADQAGDCCNVPMNEKKAEEAEEAVQKPSKDSTDKPTQ